MNERRYHCFGCRDYRGGRLVRKPNLTLEEAVIACHLMMFEYMRESEMYENELPGTYKQVTFELFKALYEDFDFMSQIYSTFAGETGVAWPVCYEAQPDGTLEEYTFTTEQVYDAYKRYYDSQAPIIMEVGQDVY